MSREKNTASQILITGASGGLGAALASAWLAPGKHLILHGRDERRLEALSRALSQKEPGAELSLIARDLTGPDAVTALVSDLRERSLVPDALILNIGYSLTRAFSDLTIAEVQDLLAANLTAQIMLAHQLLPELRQLIVISSSGAYQPGPYTNLYYASKAALSSWTTALQAERPDLEILLVCPGAMCTDFACKAGRSPAPLALSPISVASAIKKAADRGRHYLAPGLFNKLAIALTKLLPARWNAQLVKRLQLMQAESPDIRR